MNPKNFFGELKRRNVYKVAVAYAIVGWLLVQIATQVFPFLEIPNWVVRLVIVLVAIGFPIALVIAWAFELTPEGLKRMEDVDLPIGGAAKKHTWIYVVIIGAAFSVGSLVRFCQLVCSFSVVMDFARRIRCPTQCLPNQSQCCRSII